MSSENGWVDQEIFLEWLTTVVVKETGCSPSDPLLLFPDGHSSRYTLATIGKARAKGIFIYVIPPHASHFMCMTDKTCDSPYQKRSAALKRVHESTYSSTTWAFHHLRAWSHSPPLTSSTGFAPRAFRPLMLWSH